MLTPGASDALPTGALTLPITVLPAPAGEGLPPELLPWRDKLLRLMADEQPWLEPELTQRLRTHPALRFKVINAGCG